jgi:hypothetical protein
LKQEKNTFPSTTSLFGCAHFVCNSCSIRTRTALLTYFVAQPQAIVIGELLFSVMRSKTTSNRFLYALERSNLSSARCARIASSANEAVSAHAHKAGWNAGQHQKKQKSL